MNSREETMGRFPARRRHLWGVIVAVTAGLTMIIAVALALYRFSEHVFPSPTGQVPKSEQPSFDYGRQAWNQNVEYSRDCVDFIKTYPAPKFVPYSVSAAIKGCKYEYHIRND